MVELHNKYGPVLRIAPDEQSHASAQAWQDIYGQTFSDRKADLERDSSFYMIAPNGADSIVQECPISIAPRPLLFATELRLTRDSDYHLLRRALSTCLLSVYMRTQPAKNNPTSRWISYDGLDTPASMPSVTYRSENLSAVSSEASPTGGLDEIQEGVKAAFKLKTIERFITGFFPVFMKVMMFFGTAMAKNPEENFNFALLRQERDWPVQATGQILFVPGGYRVGVNQSAVMRSEAIWVDPSRYAPERWLQNPAFAAEDKKAYQPFSCGPHNCIGKRILWNFDIVTLTREQLHSS
ncbi:hypothetical protein DL769_000245 [Monosporascus sp. CRB-8-3]|nr:hypothetical protein DL769_000245 [Monosporascus sp. CRB-8-3]